MDLQSQPSKKRKLESKKSEISTECDHCKVYVPILGQRNGSSKAQFDCKICNISVQLIVKPLVSDENENEIVRSFQENFEFEDGKTEIKHEPIDIESEGTQTEPTETHPGAAPKPLFSRPPEANSIPEGSATQQQPQTEIMNEPIDVPSFESSEKSYKCKICDNDVDHKEDKKLKKHLILFHFKDDLLQRYQSDLKCQYCPKDLTSDNSLAKIIHVGVVHYEVVLDEVYEQAVKRKINERLPSSPIVQVPAPEPSSPQLLVPRVQAPIATVKGQVTKCKMCQTVITGDFDEHLVTEHFAMEYNMIISRIKFPKKCHACPNVVMKDREGCILHLNKVHVLARIQYTLKCRNLPE